MSKKLLYPLPKRKPISVRGDLQQCHNAGWNACIVEAERLRAAMAAGKDASPLAGNIGGGGVPTSEMIEAICAVHAGSEAVWPDSYGESAQRLRRDKARRGYLAARAIAHGIGALPRPDSQQPHLALPRDGGTDKLGGQP